MSALGDKLRALATEADGGTAGAIGGRVMAEDLGQTPKLDENGVITEDYWVRGKMAAAKGAHNSHYAQGWQILSMMGYSAEEIQSTVLSAGPSTANWNELLVSTADAGWIDGSGYYYNSNLSEHDNYLVFCAFGKPSSNTHGVWDTSGKPVDKGQWDAYYAALKARYKKPE